MPTARTTPPRPRRARRGAHDRAAGAAPADPALAELLETQFRLLGCDVRRPAGNLLLAAGFRRRRPPAGRLGASQYALDGEPEVRLWGFGLLLRPSAAGPGCMVLRSGRTLASWAPDPADVWEPTRAAAQLGLHGPCPRPTLLEAVRWLAEWERRLLARPDGVAHRAAARAACTHACPSCDSLADAWDAWLGRAR